MLVRVVLLLVRVDTLEVLSFETATVGFRPSEGGIVTSAIKQQFQKLARGRWNWLLQPTGRDREQEAAIYWVKERLSLDEY